MRGAYGLGFLDDDDEDGYVADIDTDDSPLGRALGTDDSLLDTYGTLSEIGDYDARLDTDGTSPLDTDNTLCDDYISPFWSWYSGRTIPSSLHTSHSARCAFDRPLSSGVSEHPVPSSLHPSDSLSFRYCDSGLPHPSFVEIPLGSRRSASASFTARLA
jgi:hypothetical protein